MMIIISVVVSIFLLLKKCIKSPTNYFVLPVFLHLGIAIRNGFQLHGETFVGKTKRVSLHCKSREVCFVLGGPFTPWLCWIKLLLWVFTSLTSWIKGHIQQIFRLVPDQQTLKGGSCILVLFSLSMVCTTVKNDLNTWIICSIYLMFL